MKTVLYRIACCAAAVMLAACSKTGDLLPGCGSGDNIVLDVSSAGAVSRAEASGAEVAVSHIDVLIFAGDETKVVHERVTGAAAAGGKIILSAKRSSFAENVGYWVYLVANSTEESEAFDALTNLNGLKAMQQRDPNIHMTGIASLPDIPQTFLMDGIAYTGDSEPASHAAVVLNDGDASADTELKAMLKRAAAKIVVRIRKGEKVEFSNESGAGEAGYYLRNMPYTTSVISGVDADAELWTPGRNASSYFHWTADVVTVTAYAYSHDWANQSALEKETRLIVNVPLYPLDKEGNRGEFQPRSYYQIPVSKSKNLLRNHCYQVAVTVNAAGATDPSEALELGPVEYSVSEWDEETIDVGGGTEHPIYLTVNTDEMEMYNIEADTATLRFASSSQVGVEVLRAYFINKFGQEEAVDRDIFDAIRATPAEGLTGNIDVYSPLPLNNAVRYIELEVTNTDGATPRTVIVEQYPLEYITNIQGWYSYRSDFGGTTYELINGEPVDNPYDSDNRLNGNDDRIVAVGGWNNGTGSWRNYYQRGGSNSSYFFTSKVAEQITSGNNRGKSNIYYYSWDESEENVGSWWRPRYEYSYEIATTGLFTPGNARMYHVRITASSGDYTVGRPRMSDGVTDPGTDNEVMVSPSFMVASQLGATFSPTQESAASHCKEYVEVYRDPETNEVVHLDDWRLPTRAEIGVIIEFQYRPNAAMDEVLAGPEYWSANGIVENPKATQAGSAAIRCIRDAYDGGK